MNKTIFVKGFILAPILMIVFFLFKFLFFSGINLSEDEKKAIIQEINYTPTTSQSMVSMVPFLYETSEGLVEKKISDFQGKPFILHIWATWCGPCVKEIGEFDAFVGKYGSKYNIVALSADPGENDKDVSQKIKEFYEKQKVSHITLAINPSLSMVRSLGIKGAPTTILFNSEGKEIGRIDGMVQWKDPRIVACIEEILKSK